MWGKFVTDKISDGLNRLFSMENIIKMVILIFTTSGLYYKLESRITILEERSNQYVEIKEDIKEIKHDIKRIFVSGKIK